MKDTQEIVLAGGCFWCTEAIFQRLKGVISVKPGYAGGKTDHPTYDQVCSGHTGHAEAIKIKFYPTQIPLEKILDIFWHTHNPTTHNRQGNDIGPQYRSAIFYANDNQRKIVEKSKKELEKSGKYKDPIVTEIAPFTNFYQAENYHQNYFEKNKGASYCDFVISPKIDILLEQYGDQVKPEHQKS